MLDEEFSDVAASVISTIPQLQAAHRQLQHCPPGQYTAMLRVRLFGAAAAGFFPGLLHTQERLAALMHLMPLDWVAAVRAYSGTPEEQRSSTAAAAARIMAYSGWQRQQQQPLPLGSYRVRDGTALQLADLQQQRQQQHAAFASLATGQPEDGAAMAPLLVRLWRLPVVSNLS
jgi:hypothetical protein